VKILFLSQIVPYPPHGGVLQRGFNIIREIAKRNDVHLLAFNHPDVLGKGRFVEDSKRVLGAYCRTVEYVDLWSKLSDLHQYAGYLWGAVSGLPFSVLAHRSQPFKDKIGRILGSETIDLVHYDTLALAQFRDMGAGLPKVLMHHNIESQLMERRSGREGSLLARMYTGQQAKKIRAYELEQCGGFDLNVTVSDADATQLKTMIPGLRIAVVPNGVDIEYFMSGNGNSAIEPALIYTGGMNMYANRDAVLYFLEHIWQKIKAEIPGVRFYAVGQDPPPELHKIAESDSCVVVTGYVDDIRPYVTRSSVYVVPLRVGGGTRLKILDAMAMGKAIVSTTIGAEGIHITDGKNILIADDPGDFAARTLALLKTPALRSNLGREARKLVENEYSWEIIGKKLQTAYESILTETKRSRELEA
jgi:glycosyltransferase involved in cell wall biosynthesis